MVADGSQVALKGILPGAVKSFFEGAGAFGAAAGTALAIVGGPVRDWILGIPVRDVDFLVEGNAINFVDSLLSHWHENFPGLEKPTPGHPFPQFGTMKIKFSPPLDGFRELDFASARREKYPRPGRAPEVEYPVSLRDDLGRRDFSINALALRFLSPGQTEVLDPFGGAADIGAKRLRVLHQTSFVDDPARVLRGLRFKIRFSLKEEAWTRGLFREAIEQNLLGTLTPQRRFDELRKALDEKELLRLFTAFHDEGVLRQIHPAFELAPEALDAASGRPPGEERQAAALGPMLRALSDSEYETLLKEWGLSRKLAASFVAK